MSRKNGNQSPRALRKRYKKRRMSNTASKKRPKKIVKYLIIGIIILGLLALAWFGYKYFKEKEQPVEEEKVDATISSEQDIDVQLLTINPYSRPGLESRPTTGIVIHYTANAGSKAQDNRDYFENLKDTHTTQASSHFIVGLEGEVIQCIPTWEIAYASNDRNIDTVSIEVCHPDETGQFTEETYASLVQLTAWLCDKFSLNAEQVIRHYDISGKICPKYFVDHEDAWQKFLQDVQKSKDQIGIDAR